MHPSIPQDGEPIGFADDTPVLVKFPRTKEEERGDRSRWPWLHGTIVQQCGPDEWQVCVEDMAVAVRTDGSRPTPRTPRRNLFFPMCYRDSSELKLRGAQ